MDTHLLVLSESFSMNTNMTGFRCFLKLFSSAMGECSLSKERVKGGDLDLHEFAIS